MTSTEELKTPLIDNLILDLRKIQEQIRKEENNKKYLHLTMREYELVVAIKALELI